MICLGWIKLIDNMLDWCAPSTLIRIHLKTHLFFSGLANRPAQTETVFSVIENGAFRKQSPQWRNSKTPALWCSVNVESGAFRKRWRLMVMQFLSMAPHEGSTFKCNWKERIMAGVTSRLFKTALTIVSYFGNVTASLFTLIIVRKFTPRWSKTIRTNCSYTQARFMG